MTMYSEKAPDRTLQSLHWLSVRFFWFWVGMRQSFALRLLPLTRLRPALCRLPASNWCFY